MTVESHTDTTVASTIPQGFWPQIDHQLARIRDTNIDSFEAVRDVLRDDRYDAVVAEVTRNGPVQQDDDSAFFAGSGGDASLREALREAGWRICAYRAAYHYVARSPIGDLLTYCEGDVLSGDHISR